ncbi:8-amino-7-oxononanoate synthase [bacterium]|nr:8-amino-7-oxononanoate synthase [bacterium]
MDEELRELEARALRRSRRVVRGAQGPEVEIDGRMLVCLGSNNYLGLAADERVILGAISALAEVGAGAGASPLLGGHMEDHEALEGEIASWLGAEAALLFGSGWHANVGVVSALVGPGDEIFSDRLNHASLIDGCRLSRATTRVFAHRDVDELERLLAASRARRRLVVTDSVFSMDGTCAPLSRIVEVAERHGAWVLVDEAHATGTFGPTGAGLVSELGLGDRVAVRMGTLGKALGGYGAFVAGARETVELLLNRARAYVFSTSLPPSVVAAARIAISIASRESSRRERLWRHARRLRAGLVAAGLDVPPLESPIVPLVAGESTDALAWASRAFDAGVWAPAVRPPTVPEGTARLRLTPIATHTDLHVERAIDVLVAAAGATGGKAA